MSKKRKGKFALSDADRKIKLEQPVNDAMDKYKEFISESTQKSDTNREVDLCELFVNCKQIESMAFLNKYENYIGLIKLGTEEELDIFFAKFVQQLHNDKDSEGIYKLGSLNSFFAFIRRITRDKYHRKKVNFGGMVRLEREEKLKRKEFHHAGLVKMNRRAYLVVPTEWY